MRLVKDYMRDDKLRHELNALTEEVFGFNFENWVQGGYFEGDYIPYSYEEDGQLIANASANRMDFLQNGKEKHYIQIGTVMTKPEYRNRGYAKELINHIIEEYKGKCDGIYLFGNLNALGFYDKLGFSRDMQYRYFLKDEIRKQLQEKATKCKSEDLFLEATDASHKESYQEAVRQSVANSALEQQNKYGLQLFYTAERDQVYYSKELDCYIVLEKDEDVLCLQSVISKAKIPLEKIVAHIGIDHDRLVLGFTPCKEDLALFCSEKYDGADDYRLFYMGEELACMERDKLYFPELSHA